MSSKIQINRLTNANIYVDGNSLLGRAEEIELPDIKLKMVEHKALGMVASIETFAGIDKLEGKIKWAAFYPDVMKKFANPFTHLQLQVRGSLETYTTTGRTEQVPVKVALTVASKGLPGGKFKQHDNVEAESEFTAYYMKVTIDGQDIAEIDVLNNIWKANGEDLLAEYNTNIGG